MGPIWLGEWQPTQLALRIGATSWLKVGASSATEARGRARAAATPRSRERWCMRVSWLRTGGPHSTAVPARSSAPPPPRLWSAGIRRGAAGQVGGERLQPVADRDREAGVGGGETTDPVRQTIDLGARPRSRLGQGYAAGRRPLASV